MEIGMLWFDDDARRPLPEKVARAAAHYQAKYGAAPTLCFVNPSMLAEGAEAAGGVLLRPARTVMVNHFWIGVGEAPARKNGEAKPARRVKTDGTGRKKVRSS